MDMPDWAKELVPLKHKQAALVLGVSERKLWTILKRHPHFERRGRANVYYPEHIAELRKVCAKEEAHPDGRVRRKRKESGTKSEEQSGLSPEVRQLIGRAKAGR